MRRNCPHCAELLEAQEALVREHRTLKHLLQASDYERQLIAYEIHDGLLQLLTGAILQFEVYGSSKKTRPKEATKAYRAGLTTLRNSSVEARRLIRGVKPPILDESGVVEAVAHLVTELRRPKGLKIAFLHTVKFERLVPVLENSIFRICQAALANACQHSRSEKVQVTLVQRKDRVWIEIRDWGIGFDTKAVPKNHFGLEGIRQRARLLGGDCCIHSEPRHGTRVVVDLPVVEREEDL